MDCQFKVGDILTVDRVQGRLIPGHRYKVVCINVDTISVEFLDDPNEDNGTFWPLRFIKCEDCTGLLPDWF